MTADSSPPDEGHGLRATAAGALAGALLVAALIAALPLETAPAFAHDQLLDSSPSANEVFDAPPTEVSLEFSDEVLALGALVIVVDPSGGSWTEGEAVLDGSRVTQPLASGMADGNYEVRWRVISGDGHPISDVLPFSVGDAAGMSRPAPLGDATEPAATAADETDDATDTGPAASAASGATRPLVVGLIGAGVAVALYAAARFWARLRRAPDDPERDNPSVSPTTVHPNTKGTT